MGSMTPGPSPVSGLEMLHRSGHAHIHSLGSCRAGSPPCLHPVSATQQHTVTAKSGSTDHRMHALLSLVGKQMIRCLHEAQEKERCFRSHAFHQQASKVAGTDQVPPSPGQSQAGYNKDRLIFQELSPGKPEITFP